MSADAERFGMSPQHWENLVLRVKAGKCVPIVGSKLFAEVAPQRIDLAREYAKKVVYPLADVTELSMVAEFARQGQPDKNTLLELFAEFALGEMAKLGNAWLNDADHPLRTLAQLPLTTFVTTSYFSCLEDALRRFRPNAEPIGVACRWNPADRDWDYMPDADRDEGDGEDREIRLELGRAIDQLVPTFERPVVFYLHGRLVEPGSLVLTESDHMAFSDDFVPDQGAESSPIPSEIRNQLSNNTWFFMGYGAADRNLRGLVRDLARQVKTQRAAVAVQLETAEAIEGKEASADDFLTKYFQQLLDRNVEVVLHDVRDFLTHLKAQVL